MIPLLRHSRGRSVGRQRDPGVTCLLPHHDDRRREIRVGEVVYGDGDNFGKAFVLPVDGGTAGRTEIESQRVAAFGRPLPRCRVAIEGDLCAAEPRLVADDGAGAASPGDGTWRCAMVSPSIVS
jgi:hypothetical protein